MPSDKRHDPNKPSRLLRVGAFAGLAFMHIPVLVIILYAFTTEDRTYQFPPPGFTLHWFDVAFGRADIWPVGDVGLQAAIARALKLRKRPNEKQMERLSRNWRPWRTVAARLFWIHEDLIRKEKRDAEAARKAAAKAKKKAKAG